MAELKNSILYISASPRKNSFSGAIAENILSEKSKKNPHIKIIKINTYQLNISPCSACNCCKEKGICVIDDDMQHIYNLLKSVDAIVISSPIYFSSLPGTLKNLIDRCQVFWWRKDVGEKKEAFIVLCSGRSYNGVFDGALKTLKHFFSVINFMYNEKNIICAENTDEKKEDDIINGLKN